MKKHPGLKTQVYGILLTKLAESVKANEVSTKRSARVGQWAIWLLAFCVIGGSQALALNPIHESVYSAYPSSLSHGEPSLHLAAIIPEGGDWVEIPAALSFGIGASAELGAGLKTIWGNDGDHIPYFVLGGQLALTSRSSLGLHLLFDANGGKNNGLTFTGDKRIGHGRKLYSELHARLGFMEALVTDDALMAFEGQWIPSLILLPNVTLQCGVVASSQTKHFNDFFALDLEPGVRVPTGRESAVVTTFTLGLAGEHRTDFRAKVAAVHAF